MTKEEIINKLIEYQRNYPELTFQNNGYEYIPEILEKYPEQVKEISTILKKLDSGFTEFNNFKLLQEGGFAVRYQGYWDDRFIGVNYFNIKETD